MTSACRPRGQADDVTRCVVFGALRGRAGQGAGRAAVAGGARQGAARLAVPVRGGADGLGLLERRPQRDRPEGPAAAATSSLACSPGRDRHHQHHQEHQQHQHHQQHQQYHQQNGDSAVRVPAARPGPIAAGLHIRVVGAHGVGQRPGGHSGAGRPQLLRAARRGRARRQQGGRGGVVRTGGVGAAHDAAAAAPLSHGAALAGRGVAAARGRVAGRLDTSRGRHHRGARATLSAPRTCI